MTRIAEIVATVEEVAGKARQQLVIRPEREIIPLKKAREYAAWVLARASGPLSVDEILIRMTDKGYLTASEHPERYLKRILRSHPGLFCSEGDRWSLGCQDFSSSVNEVAL